MHKYCATMEMVLWAPRSLDAVGHAARAGTIRLDDHDLFRALGDDRERDRRAVRRPDAVAERVLVEVGEHLLDEVRRRGRTSRANGSPPSRPFRNESRTFTPVAAACAEPLATSVARPTPATLSSPGSGADRAATVLPSGAQKKATTLPSSSVRTSPEVASMSRRGPTGSASSEPGSRGRDECELIRALAETDGSRAEYVERRATSARSRVSSTISCGVASPGVANARKRPSLDDGRNAE